MSKQTDSIGETSSKEPLKQIDENAIVDTNLLNSVEDRLANLRSIISKEESNPAVESEDIDTEDESVTDSSTPDKKDDEQAEPDSSTPADKVDENKPGPTLPEAYVRCAVGLGWKQEEVIEEFKKDPDRALKVFSNLYTSRNELSSRYAQLGRTLKQTSVKNEPEVKEIAVPTVDLNKLKQTLGDDALPLIEVIDAQSKQIKLLLNQKAEVKPEPQDIELEDTSPNFVEQAGIEQQIHQFFESDGMKLYTDVYGKLKPGQNWSDLTPGQRQNRFDVIKTADMIVGGAHLQKTKMSVDEALLNAHLLATRPYYQKIILNELKGKVVSKSKGLTLQPSKGSKKTTKIGGDPSEIGSRSKEQLVEDTQRKLSKLFG